jgi:DNA-binding XRE family transcriptional regulator
MRTGDIIENHIKEKREQRGHLAWKCAEWVGVHITTFSAWENGRKAPTLEQTWKLAAYLQVSPLDLYPQLGEIPDFSGERPATRTHQYRTKPRPPLEGVAS